MTPAWVVMLAQADRPFRAPVTGTLVSQLTSAELAAFAVTHGVPYVPPTWSRVHSARARRPLGKWLARETPAVERMAESVQVVYLSDDPAVADWALEVGFERAAVVTAPPPFD